MRSTGSPESSSEVPAATGLSRAAAEGLARTLRAVADPTRLQILSALLLAPAHGATVGALTAVTGLRQPTVSHHLRIMSEDGLLIREQLSRHVWYSIAPDRAGTIEDLLGPRGLPTADPVDPADLPPSLRALAERLAYRFGGVLSPETVRACVAESQGLLAAQAVSPRRLAALTARFAEERLLARAMLQGAETTPVPDILFVCVRNAGRSQLAAGIARQLSGERARIRTAGSAPAARIDPIVGRVLEEIGVPLVAEFPKPLTDDLVRAADVVVTMGCGDACPVYPGARYLDWPVADPLGRPVEEVRAIRDDIEGRVRTLLRELGLAPA